MKPEIILYSLRFTAILHQCIRGRMKCFNFTFLKNATPSIFFKPVSINLQVMYAPWFGKRNRTRNSLSNRAEQNRTESLSDVMSNGIFKEQKQTGNSKGSSSRSVLQYTVLQSIYRLCSFCSLMKIIH